MSLKAKIKKREKKKTKTKKQNVIEGTVYIVLTRLCDLVPTMIIYWIEGM